jgi:hypothetical protein
MRNPSAFKFRHDGRDYGCLLWADCGVLRKQFGPPPEAELPSQVTTLDGNGASLGLATFGIARKHPFIFLALTSELSAYVLAVQLRRRHGENIGSDDAADPNRLAAQPAIVDFLLRTWHVLDQRGAT